MTVTYPSRIVARVTVPAAEDMSTETFCLHMSARHADSLGGLSHLDPARLTPYVEECYRLFHRNLHQHRHDLSHEHLAPEGQ